MNISGGNKPKNDSDTKKTEKIINGEHVSTRLVSKEPKSTTKESTNNNTNSDFPKLTQENARRNGRMNGTTACVNDKRTN